MFALSRKIFAIFVILFLIFPYFSFPASAISLDLESSAPAQEFFYGGKDEDASEEKAAEKFEKGKDKVGIPYIENRGQIGNKDVKFYANVFSGSVFLTERSISYLLLGKDKNAENKTNLEDGEIGTGPAFSLKEIFLDRRGALVKLFPQGLKQALTKVSIFKGKEDEWLSGLASYEDISLGEVWNGIEVVSRIKGNNVEKIFNIDPQGNPDDIRVKFEGTKGVEVSPDGKLAIKTALGDLSMTKPVACQIIDGEKRDVSVAYILKGKSSYGFEVGDYDPDYRLVIDPLLASTYFGSAANAEYTKDMALDGSGNIYLTGSSTSTSYPTTAGVIYPAKVGLEDAVVSIINSDMTGLIASTFLGGSANDRAESIVLDGSEIIVAGNTKSSNFPVSAGAYDTTYDGVTRNQPFITRLNSTLTTILASTYFGKGATTEKLTAVAVDSNHKIFVTGYTSSSTFQTTAGAWDTSFGGSTDNFVSKFNNTLAASPTSLEASTYVGGTSYDHSMDIRIDSGDNPVLVGDTSSSGYPSTAGAYQETIGSSGYSLFLTRMNNSLTSVSNSTFIGGNDPSSYDYVDRSNAIDFDNSGNVYIVGTSGYGGFPTTAGAYRQTFNSGGQSDAFIAKISSNFSSLDAATYFGGEGSENQAYSIDVDSSNNVFVVGSSYPSDDSFANIPVTAGAYQTEPSVDGEWYQEAFISKFNSSLSTLQASTLIDGNDDDDALFLKVNASGQPVAVFDVDSSDLATLPGSFSATVGTGNKYIITLDADLSGAAGPEMNHLEITGSASQTAGASQTITLTAYDQNGDLYTGYTGDKSLTFSGPSNALDGTAPTCSDKNGSDVAVGTATTVTFSNGVATCLLKLYRAQSLSLDVDDGTYDSLVDAAYDLDVTVSPGSLSNEDSQISVSADPAVVLAEETVTVTAKDAYRNLLTSGGAEVELSISGINTHSLEVTDNNNGTYTAVYTPSCDLGGDEIAGTIDGDAIGSDTDGTDDGTYEITTQIKITITVKDRFGSQVNYGGDDLDITISGANSATPTVLDNGDGTYSAYYIPTSAGTDHVTGTLNGRTIGSDADGNSDGSYDVEICSALVSQADGTEGENRLAEGSFPKKTMDYLGEKIAEISSLLVPTVQAETKKIEEEGGLPENPKSPPDLEKLSDKEKIDALSVPFIKNEGFLDDAEIKFISNLSFGTFYITGKKMGYNFSLKNKAQDEEKEYAGFLQETFVDSEGGAINFLPEGKSKAGTKVSYFRGNDKDKWQDKVASYNRLDLGEIWEGISVKLRAYNKKVEKIFYVSPGTDPDVIRLKAEGADNLSIGPEGQIIIQKGETTLEMSAPIAFQETGDGEKKAVQVSYEIGEDFTYRFKVGEYDRERELVIDPWLGGTYLGGSNYEEFIDPYTSTGNKLARDSDGNIFVVGSTNSTDFPTTLGAYDTTKLNREGVYISKLNSDLTELLASTVIEGTSAGVGDLGESIAIDPSGNIFILTTSFSTDFPLTAGAYDDTKNNSFGNIIISKLNNNLTDLLASTTIEGSNEERAENLVLDASGNVYVFGETYAMNEGDNVVESLFPVTAGAYRTSHLWEGFPDASFNTLWGAPFVAKFNNNLTSLLASTFFPGNAPQNYQTLAMSSGGNVIISGRVVSQSYIDDYGLEGTPSTPGAYDAVYSSSKSYISILSSDLTILVASTYLGGTAGGVVTPINYLNSIDSDSQGNIFISGSTNANNFPATSGAYDTSYNDDTGLDVIVAKLNSSLTSLEAATYLGTMSDDYSLSVQIDSNDKVFISGHGGDLLPDIVGSFNDDITGIMRDAFIARFDNDLTDIERATYVGGIYEESSASIILDPDDNVYISGLTGSPDFPAVDYPSLAYNPTYSLDGSGLDDDAFIAKLDNFLSNESDPDETSIGVQSCTPDGGNTVTTDDDDDYLRLKESDKKKVTFEALISSNNKESEKVKDNKDGGTGIRDVSLKAERGETVDGDFEIKKLNQKPKNIVLPSEYLVARCSVYRYLDINSDIDDGDIQEVTFKFEVKKQWVGDKDIVRLAVLRSNTEKSKVLFNKSITNKNQDVILSFDSSQLTGWWTIIGCSSTPAAPEDDNVMPEDLSPPDETAEEVSETDKISQDIDGDGNLEESIDQDSQESNGYEEFFDPDGSSDGAIAIDGDQDGRIDHFVAPEGSSVPTVYWDPDNGIVSGVSVENADDDPSQEYLFDSDNDEEKKSDRYYDIEDKKIKRLEAVDSISFLDKTRDAIDENQEVIVPVSVGTMMLPLLVGLFEIGKIVELPFLFKETAFRLFGFLFMRRKKRYDWGTVYDLETGKPVPMALVSAVDWESGNVKETRMTDQFGSYYFLVAPGTYRLETTKAGYSQPGPRNLGEWPTLYNDSYDFGELKYDKPDRITLDIPMERTEAGAFASTASKFAWRQIFSFLFWACFLTNIIIFLIYMSTFNGLMLVGYLFFAFMKSFTLDEPRWGVVVNQQEAAEPFAAVKLIGAEDEATVARTITDEHGRYYLIANRGEYSLSAYPVKNVSAGRTLEVSLPTRAAVKEKIVI